MKQLFKSMKVLDWIHLIALISFIMLQTYLEIELISYTGKMIKLIEISETNVKMYWNTGLRMLMIALIILICIIIANYISINFSSRVAKDLRRKIFIKVNSFSASEINKFNTSSLITRSTNDVTQVQRTLQLLRMLFTAPAMATFAILKITSNSVELTWTSVGFVVITISVIIILLFVTMPKFNNLQKKIDKVNLVTRENLTGIRVVRAYNGEKFQENKFEKSNEELTKTNLFLSRIMSLLNPFISLIMSMMTLTINWVGANLIGKDKLSYSTLSNFSQYSMHVIMSFMFITLLIIMIPRGLISLRRINEILNTEVSIQDGNIESSENIGTIEFRNVSFNYPNAEEKVLDDISFKCEKGETVAFIGSTGSGKSTLINLIPRFYDVTSGQVLVDGIDVRAYKVKSLHSKIGYVPQKANLFSGDIRSNMELARENITDKEIENVLDIAQCNFIEKIEEGYIQPVSRGGKNFSGGQKQRLSIARAIAKNPEIYIFDDSFSALDFKTDKTLRSALRKYTKDSTCLIVAQRVNTIKDADKIIVLDDGKMVGMGKHDELLKTCKVYKEIVDSQIKKEGM